MFAWKNFPKWVRLNGVMRTPNRRFRRDPSGLGPGVPQPDGLHLWKLIIPCLSIGMQFVQHLTLINPVEINKNGTSWEGWTTVLHTRLATGRNSFVVMGGLCLEDPASVQPTSHTGR